MSPDRSHRIFVGPAGWSYADWDGIVYPRPRPRGFHQAEYLARFFDVIEINTSFYQPLRPDVSRSWVSKVEHNQDFRFTAKLLKLFTHDRSASRADEKAFKQGLAPFAEAGRLGALLLQFPWSFRNTKQNHEYLSGLFLEFMEYPLVLEVRHSSWNHPDVFNWLAEQGVGFCNIDQPLFRRSIKPSDRTSGPVGYVRLHGRNYKDWFKPAERPRDRDERYNYLYTVEELEPWVERINNIAEAAEVTYVIANNHYEGKAVANALQLIHLITGERVPVPQALAARYQELKPIAAPETVPALGRPVGPRQADLFV